MKDRGQALRLGLISGLVVVVCLLIAHPFAETGIMDDWSYFRSAQLFAQTGKLTYVGWSEPILGWLAPWGALFIKLFGSSFFAARLSILPLVFGCIVLFHLCAARFGIRPFNAVLAGLTFGLSPLFLPLAATFMTDVPSLFFLLMCLYFCQRAVLSTSARETIAWLCLAALSNVAGGTVRQVVWLGALVLVPTAGWLLRKRSGVLLATIVLWIGSAISVLLVMQWYKHQPYSIPSNFVLHAGQGAIQGTLHRLLFAFLCLGLVLLPVLIAWTFSIRHLRGTRRKLFWVALALALLGFTFVLHRFHDKALMPWIQNILDSQGVWSRPEILGSSPVTLGPGIRTAVSGVVVLAWVAFLAQFQWPGWKALSLRYASKTSPTGVLSYATTMRMLGVYLSAYVVLLVPRAAAGVVFDRYLLGLFPFVLMLLARMYQEQIAPRLPVLVIATLCLFSIYSVASLHDWFASLRALVATNDRLQAAGIPRTEIEAGWESDGLVQVQMSGHINNQQIRVPASAYHPIPPEPRPPECSNWFYSSSPAITPRFVLVLSPLSCFANSTFPPQHFRSWLPPFEHAIYIQRVQKEN